MNKKNDPENETDTAEDEQSLGEFFRVTLWILACIGGLALIALFWFLVSYALDPRLTDPVGFIGVSVLNTLIFTAIIAQVLIYRKQLHAMKQSNDHMTKIQRPFVYLNALNWQWYPDPGRPGKYGYSIRPELANSGNMPTIDMEVGIQYAFRTTPLPENFDFPLSEKGLTLIPPKANLRIAMGTITDDQLLALLQGAGYFYFWGEATYKDGFDGTPVHTTQFCQYVMGVAGDPSNPRNPIDPKGTSVEIIFAFYPKHNSGD